MQIHAGRSAILMSALTPEYIQQRYGTTMCERGAGAPCEIQRLNAVLPRILLRSVLSSPG